MTVAIEQTSEVIRQMSGAITQIPVPMTGLMENMSIWFKSPLSSEADVLGLVESGVTTSVYEALSDLLDLPKDAIGAETTIRHRLKTKSRLTPEESERLVRIVRVYAMALGLFGSPEKALAWMHKPVKYLPEKPAVTPLALAARDAGARLLEDKLQRTAYGVF